MAIAQTKDELKQELLTSFTTVRTKGQQVVDLYNALKTLVASDRQTIASTTVLSQAEKDAWDAVYATRALEVKTDIQAALDA
jgi:hypothetical protein